MPIAGLTEQRRLPRLGKIRIGIKKTSEKTGKEYPAAVDYFVLPESIIKLFTEHPKELPIMIPTEDDEIWCSQYFKRYSSYRGLTCKGDGTTCWRMIDTETGEMAGKDTKDIVWKKDIPCSGRNCPYYVAEECKEVMCLQFIMPDIPGLGVWQIDTSSINSIKNINNAAGLIRSTYKRLAFIPLVLTVGPQETIDKEGKKKTIQTLRMDTRSTMRQLLTESKEQAHQWLAIPAPAEDEAPDEDGTYPAEILKPAGQSEADQEFEKMGQERDRIRAEKQAAVATKPEVIETTAKVTSSKPSIEEQEKRAEAVLAQADKILAGEKSQQPTQQTSYIDMKWLRESLEKLQKVGLKAYSNRNLLSYIRVAFKVEAASVSAAVPQLKKEDAEKLAQYIREALMMADPEPPIEEIPF
jgi:hypothetical protein